MGVVSGLAHLLQVTIQLARVVLAPRQTNARSDYSCIQSMDKFREFNLEMFSSALSLYYLREINFTTIQHESQLTNKKKIS